MKLAPVQSFNQLKTKVGKDSRYKELIINFAKENGLQDLSGLGLDSNESLNFIQDMINSNGVTEEDIIEEINAFIEEEPLEEL